MDMGNSDAAAINLREDLWNLRGDMYAQDQLLSEVNRYERKGIGADIYLGNWNPLRGTWDNINVVTPTGRAIPINTYGGWDDGWSISIGVNIGR